jgi:ATP-binding cassette, subfamily B, multidrug efflux pump
MSIRGGFMTRMQSREEDFQLTKLSRKATQFIWGYMNDHLGQMGLALFATLSATAISLTLPYLVKITVDNYIAQQNLSGLTLISIAYLILVGLQWMATYWQSYLSNWVGQKIVHRLR